MKSSDINLKRLLSVAAAAFLRKGKKDEKTNTMLV